MSNIPGIFFYTPHGKFASSQFSINVLEHVRYRIE